MSRAAHTHIIETLFGSSPYDGVRPEHGDRTPPGWGQDNPVFERLIRDVRPSIIVEVGTWLGASAIRMADLLAAEGLSATIVCVDTWLGSPIHWLEPEYRDALDLKHGYPRLYHRFLANVVAAGHAGTVVPIPQPADNAARLLARLGLRPELIYIDADHEATSVYADLTNYWPLLADDGVMFGDDFIANWPGVVRAVEMFAGRLGLRPEVVGEKWILRKGDGN